MVTWRSVRTNYYSSWRRTRSIAAEISILKMSIKKNKKCAAALGNALTHGSMDVYSNGYERDDGIQGCKYCIYFSYKLCNFLESSLCQNNCVTIIYILLKNILLYISRKLIRSRNIVFTFFLNCTQHFIGTVNCPWLKMMIPSELNT